MAKKIYEKRSDTQDERIITMMAINEAIKICGSQKKLATLCNVAQQTVSDWLLGKCRPSPRRAVEIEKSTDGIVSRREILSDFPWL